MEKDIVQIDIKHIRESISQSQISQLIRKKESPIFGIAGHA